ncbi:MAG: DNA methyltransferase [Nitrospira sp.]|nr:DNA methyltransferase [Nitrospira sp.]
MAKIDITGPELIWQGKYNEDGTRREVARADLPFQVIETVNESRATREEKKKTANRDIFDDWPAKEGDTFEEGWKNKLIWGDNLLVIDALLKKSPGKIDLIYIDPPFTTGADFSFNAQVGESGEAVSKAQTIIEEKAYRDTWGGGIDSYIAMMYDRLVLMRELLSDTGSIYVHCDWRVNAYLRLVLDEVFGSANFVNEIIWHYEGPQSPSPLKFASKHDTLFRYAKNIMANRGFELIFDEHERFDPAKYKRDAQGRYFYTIPKGDYTAASIARLEAEGRVFRTKNGTPRIKQFVRVSPDGATLLKKKKIPDVWRITSLGLAAGSREHLGYPTQKPEALLERIIKASSNEGDLVADFFCGSGTTAAVAEKLGRRWITCDLGRWAVHTTRKRMLGIENCKPFDVLNLGKYERQHWQDVTFGEKKDRNTIERKLYQYLVFILELYGARPLASMTHLHGRKGKALVHIGAVDAPVTINQVNQAVDEIIQLKQKELHVLGWEWEMGLNDLVIGDAKRKGVKLSLFNIPREVMEPQAADKGDIRFFELAYLEAGSSSPGKLSVKVELQNFVIPDADAIPEDAREKISKWSDYVDYWAVDWDFQGDTFMQGWVAYRTRRERTLPLVSDEHTYSRAGEYRVLVKVIDIFGNDTSRMLTVTVQ